MTLGFAMKMVSFSGGSINPMGSIVNVQADLAAQIIQVGDGRLQVRLSVNANSAISAPSTFVLNANQWYYVELKATTSLSGPTVTLVYDLHINEVSILAGTLTSNPSFVIGTEGNFTGISFIDGNGNILDDVTVTDGEFLGDVAIGVLFPRLDGDTIQWIPLNAGAHYLMVKEHTPDFDTTYNFTPTVGNIDQYFLDQIIGFTGIIKGARGLWCVRKDNSGLAEIQGVYKSGGGTTVLAANQFACSFPSYIYAWDPSRKSLFTGLDWTPAEVNAMQLGIKRTA